MTIQILFGQVLQELRKDRGYSQEALAFKSGYHRTYISLLERGRKNPTLMVIFKLAQALDIAPDDLLRKVALKMEDATEGKIDGSSFR